MAKDDIPIFGKIKDKLVHKKEEIARAGRHLTGGAPSTPNKRRLPPGQRLVEKWPVLDLGLQPRVPLDKWELGVRGAVETEIDWNWDAFMAQPQTEDTSDIHCVTSWSLYDNRWTGVSAKHLIAQVKPKPTVTHVVFTSHDGYTTNVPYAAFNDDDVLIAHSWQGKPIPVEHGGPVRIILPKLYFWKSAKWVKRILFLERDQPGYWEARGYHNVGDPWAEQRYDSDD